MIAQREGRIINTLTAICIVAGFLCFALILLPDQLEKARAIPSSNLPNAPAKLSAIIPMGQAKMKTEPAGKPPVLNLQAPSPKLRDEPVPDNDDATQIAGGHGAAMENSDASEEIKISGPPSGSVEAFTLPISSIAHRESSALDGNLTKGKKQWLATPFGLEADVAFWRDIYSKYSSNHVVLHHPRHLQIVYDVVDLTDVENDSRLNDVEKERFREKRVEARRDEITAVLNKLATRPPASALGEEDIRIKKLFAEINEENAFKRATEDDAVRAQLGQSDKFLAGLIYSGRYLGGIEKIFDSYDLPRELTRIIFVESMFEPNAVSSAGASGVWQFMHGTGKLYLKVNSIVDERNDPIASSHAAARLLRRNFESLGSWPLAINAYNAGPGRIEQAVTTLGTDDIGKIIRNFKHPSYGFASRNFFPEFLAALDVAEHAEKYFGQIEFERPLKCEVVRPTYNISLPEVSRIADVDMETITGLNPAFTPKTMAGKNLIPAGFTIRVPERKGDLFLIASARAPKSKAGPMKHVAQPGESLESIARIYDVTPQAILKSNSEMSRIIHTGQTIVVPVGKR